MYNETLKTEFIRDYTTNNSTPNICQETFNAFEEIERQEHKDLCELSVEQLQPITDNIIGVMTSSRWQRLIILRAYAKWCLAKHIPGATENIFQLETENLDKIRRVMVSGPTHLQACLDEVFEPDDDMTIDVTYRCYLWLAFAGMDERDIMNVHKEHIHFDTMTVVYNGEEYPIYREGIKAIRYASELKSLVYRNKTYRKAGDVVLDRVPGDSIFRGTRGTSDYNVLVNVIGRRFTRARRAGKTDVVMSYKKVFFSGIFYRMYEDEKAGIPADFSGIVRRYYKPGSYKNTKRTLMIDYQRWKAAFSI